MNTVLGRCDNGGMEETIFGFAEHHVHGVAMWVKLIIEVVGVVVIAVGVIFSLVCYGRHLLARDDANYLPLRLSLARYLIVALEFQLAADILGTAIAPSWNEIGKLAAIAAIRTILNFFLEREIAENREMLENPDAVINDEG